MKNLFISVLVGFMFLGTHVYAASYSPGSEKCTTNETSTAGELGRVESCFTTSGLSLLYRANVPDKAGDPIFEEGAYKGSYTTVFSNTALDPEDGVITYDAGNPAIICPECYAVVKDGDHNPAAYMINLGSWNGTDSLDFNDFWVGSGGISHISIYGKNAVPIPAAVWLFGSGLVGLIGASRRKSTSAFKA